VTSPTFVLAREHPSLVGGPPLVHVDGYRLAGATELGDLDLDTAAAVTVVEWGRGLAESLAPDRVQISIDRDAALGTGADAATPAGAPHPDAEPDADADAGDELRTVRVDAVGGRWALAGLRRALDQAGTPASLG